MIQKQTTEGVQTQRKNKGRSRARVGRSNLQDKDELFSWTCAEDKTHTPWHSRAHTNTFTLCLCGLGEPAKLSFLLLSEVSQRDPLVLPTCSSHSQTAEEAVSQYTAEREGERERSVRQETAAIQTTVQTQLPCPEKLQNKGVGHRVKSCWHNRLTAKSEPGLCCPATAKIIQCIHF